MRYIYKPQGVCSSKIILELDGNIVQNVEFVDGCDGNLQGIARLAAGMPAEELIAKLSGIRCGWKNTSCPDQMATALQKALEKSGEKS